MLEIVGTGYKVEAKGDSLVFSLGYSNPVEFPLPEGISAKVDKATRIEFKGFDKEELGQLWRSSGPSGRRTPIKARASNMPAK